MSILFKVDHTLIDENFSINSSTGWDSLNHMKLIFAIEDEFNISLSDEDAQSVVNYSILLTTIESYL